MSNDHIRVLKLVTGEEILAFVDYPGDVDYPGFKDDPDKVKEKVTHITISDPVQLMFGQRPDGSFGMQIIPWAVSVDGPITLDLKHVMFDETPKADLQQRLREITSGIVTPPEGIVLPK